MCEAHTARSHASTGMSGVHCVLCRGWKGLGTWVMCVDAASCLGIGYLHTVCLGNIHTCSTSCLWCHLSFPPLLRCLSNSISWVLGPLPPPLVQPHLPNFFYLNRPPQRTEQSPASHNTISWL